jgi:hypothetical protein
MGIASGRTPEVYCADVATHIYLTFRGTRDAHVQDRDTRLRITLQVLQAARLWKLLDERLTGEEKAPALE